MGSCRGSSSMRGSSYLLKVSITSFKDAAADSLLETRNINGTTETQKDIAEDKLQILRKMLDKEEIQVPSHNPTIDLTVDSDAEDGNGRTPSKNGHSRKGKERATPRTPGSFRPNGSLFHDEINLPDDDASLRHSTRRWHSPASRPALTNRQTPSTNKYLDRSTLGTSTWSTHTPTRPKLGQTISSLGNSIAKLESAQKGNASPATSVRETEGRDRWGLNAKQREKLDKTVPRFREWQFILGIRSKLTPL
jgi:hypothetical protein